MPEYRILADTPQADFGKLRSKVQLFGGGYGNGKTAAAVVQKALTVAKDYPGANILIARSTYPKLNDTIRKEFIKWCPPSWIKSFAKSQNSTNTCILKNGTYINFRYIAQQGKGASQGEQTTSNLLSATYDLIIVDQMEDPEISHKDFTDLLGRLRGSTKYVGNDLTMPMSGPRWFVICVNPTRNWVFQKLVAPLQKFNKYNLIDNDLLVKRYPRTHELHGRPILDSDNQPELLISLVEGSTYTNAHNLGEDFIETLESAYQGQQKDRYLYGEWASYEGLVHPAFNEVDHNVSQLDLERYYEQQLDNGVIPEFIEAYDFGIASPACYLLAFVDRYKNVCICDGWYKAELNNIEEHQKLIWEIRNKWGIGDLKIRADPSIHKRTQVAKSSRSKSIAQLFKEGKNAVDMGKGDNDIMGGITKVNSYLAVSSHHRHPITRDIGAPHLYIASGLDFINSEFSGYMWQINAQGERIDKPIDKNDHAMDTIKYMLSKQPSIATRKEKPRITNYLHNWSTVNNENTDSGKKHRYG